jgi:hypothetical protein
LNNFCNVFFYQFQVELPILSNAECTNLILAGGFENEIKPFEVCAGFASGQKDTCRVNNIKNVCVQIRLTRSIHASFLNIPRPRTFSLFLTMIDYAVL